MKNTLLFCTLATPLGAMRAMASVQGLCLLEFSDSPAPGLRRAQQQVEALRGGPAQPGKNAVLEQTEQELAQYFARQRQQAQNQQAQPTLAASLLRTAAGCCAGHAAFMGGSRVVLRHAVGVFFKSFVQNRWDAPPSV